MKNKCILLVLDGLGDLPAPSLDGQTPLEAADTPVMNRLASAGLYGLVDPIGPGVTPNTHSGCGALFGVFPEELDLLKRGPIEAAGAGRPLQAGEIAVRANFATLALQDGRLMIFDRRAGRIAKETKELASALSGVDLGDGIIADLQSTDQHRCVLVLSGPGLDPRLGDTDPGDGEMPSAVKPCVPYSTQANFTAAKIDLFLEIAHQRLAVHPVNVERARLGLLPANGIITRGAGAGFDLHNAIRDSMLSAAVVAGCNTVIGLARTVGFEPKLDPRFTADEFTDLGAKIETAIAALQQHDMVFVHIKAPDLLAHDHQPGMKKEFLEQVDDAMKLLEEQVGLIIAVAADHSTDCNSGAHTADPIPALLCSPSRTVAETQPLINFGEKACADGSMPRLTSHDFVKIILETFNN